MIQVLKENRLYKVELDDSLPRPARHHRSQGLHRVLERQSGRMLFETWSRDKSYGVFEYLTQEAGASVD